MQNWLPWIAVRRKRIRNYLLGTTFDYDKGYNQILFSVVYPTQNPF